MSISFSYRNNVQVIKFSEQLSQEEFAQVLLKVSEKIKQGRKLYLFHLELFQNQDEGSQSKIVHLIKFCFQHKLNLALCLPQKSWSIYSSGSVALAKMFNTEAEGLLYLETLSGRTDEKPLTIDEAKKKETDELLKKYEIFHKVDVLDPYHLKNMNQIYSFAPTIEAIESLEKATIDLSRRRENINRLDAQCGQLSKQAIDVTLARNQALNEAELNLKQKKCEERAAILVSYQKIYAQQISDLAKELEEVETAIRHLVIS